MIVILDRRDLEDKSKTIWSVKLADLPKSIRFTADYIMFVEGEQFRIFRGDRDTIALRKLENLVFVITGEMGIGKLPPVEANAFGVVWEMLHGQVDADHGACRGEGESPGVGVSRSGDSGEGSPEGRVADGEVEVD